MKNIEKYKKLPDDVKMKKIRNLKDSGDKEELIASLKNDTNKLKMLDELTSELEKGKVILTLNSDTNKINAMKEYIKKDRLCMFIINSLDSDDNKINCLNLLQDDKNKMDIIENIEIKNDEQRLGIVRGISNDSYSIERFKVGMISTMKDYNYKIQGLEYISEWFRETIIKQIPPEGQLYALSKIESKETRRKIIERVPKEIREEVVADIEDEEIASLILTAIDDDKFKIEQMKNLKSEINKAIVSTSLKSDDAKLKIANEIKDEKNKILVKMSLTDRENLKRNFLRKDRKYSSIGLDQDMTIGMEIESEGEKSEIINDNVNKIIPNMIGAWEAKEDISLENGVEVISPIMGDFQDDVEDIYMICDMLQKCGQNVSERCGGHIHIGADFLKSKEAYANLLEIWGNAEEVIYLISNEKGELPRRECSIYASPVSPIINEAIANGSIMLKDEDELEDFVTKLQQVQSHQGRKSRYFGINLLNANEDKNTIEFREPNGTINPDTWIENIRLFGRIIEASERLAEIENMPEINERFMDYLRLKDKLKQIRIEEENYEEEKMETLLSLLFDEEEKDVYRERFYANSKLLQEADFKSDPFAGLMFKKVDFKKGESKIFEGQYKEFEIEDEEIDER